MSGPIYSDDGYWMWNGTEWIPATQAQNAVPAQQIDQSVVTNVARGDIVDDDALIDALERRKVYAVGLDVYKGEPNLNPGYLKFKQAFILPHLGSATKRTRWDMAYRATKNLEDSNL